MEVAATAGVTRYCLIKIALTHYYLVNEVARRGSGAMGNSKNCGGNDREVWDHASRRRECQWDGVTIRSVQRYGIGKQRHSATSNFKSMPRCAGQQSSLDSDGVLIECKHMHPNCEVLPVLNADMDAKETLQQIWGCDNVNPGI